MRSFSVIIGPPGAGKTQTMLQEISQHPGRYILAVPRIELADERLRDLNMLCGNKIKPAYEKINSKTSGRLFVSKAIREAIERHECLPHVVLFITHVRLTTTDFSDISGWHLRIDEVPQAVYSHSTTAPASTKYLRDAYDLEPSGKENWSGIAAQEPTIRNSLRKTSFRFCGVIVSVRMPLSSRLSRPNTPQSSRKETLEDAH